MDPIESMPLLEDEAPDAHAGEVIVPYLTEDGKHFARDFWVRNRLGAQKGASVKAYGEALVLLGALGAFGYDGDDPDTIRDGNGRTIHNYVVGPDEPGKLWNELMTSPGTLGWNPLGAFYRYIGGPRDQALNMIAWEQAGCPKQNAYGYWANDGLPEDVVAWGRMHPTERANVPYPWPGYRGYTPRGRRGGR